MNTQSPVLPARTPDARLDQIVKLAVMAVGGQGGGVLSDWIIGVAERNGYAVQATSVAGVAQRTGATIYYVEMLPESGARPVFSLMPSEGDVDILIAAEWMEAGRAVLRGFVTPDRTTLIASTHRALAVSEKIVPGSGLADPAEVRRATVERSKELIAFDMEQIAQDAGSVISASLFGALAGSGTLPFPTDSYRETIQAAGRGVEASLRAFDAALAAAEARATDPRQPATGPARMTPTGPGTLMTQWGALSARAAALPAPVRRLAEPGLRKVVDYQDLDYGTAYLDRIDRALDADRDQGPDQSFAFTAAAAKAIANAMCYDDILRVADLKTRASRRDRIATEVRATEAHLVHVTEYVHPGAAEVVSLLPVRWGERVMARPRLYRLIDRVVNRGRRLRSDAIWPFVQLYVLGGMRRHRRKLLRHRTETAHLQRLTDLAHGHLARDYALGTAVWSVQRLVKGYSDTHARGLSKLDRVLDGLSLVEGRADAADWIARLVAAALADPEGTALDGALETIRSFTPED